MYHQILGNIQPEGMSEVLCLIRTYLWSVMRAVQCCASWVQRFVIPNSLYMYHLQLHVTATLLPNNPDTHEMILSPNLLLFPDTEHRTRT